MKDRCMSNPVILSGAWGGDVSVSVSLIFFITDKWSVVCAYPTETLIVCQANRHSNPGPPDTQCVYHSAILG